MRFGLLARDARRLAWLGYTLLQVCSFRRRPTLDAIPRSVHWSRRNREQPRHVNEVLGLAGKGLGNPLREGRRLLLEIGGALLGMYPRWMFGQLQAVMRADLVLGSKI